MRYETFIISARDSNHKFTQQGVNCRAFYANVHGLPGPGQGAVTARAPHWQAAVSGAEARNLNWAYWKA